MTNSFVEYISSSFAIIATIPRNQRTASMCLPRSLVPLFRANQGERTVEDSGRRRVTLARRPWPQNYPKCSIIEVFSRCRTRVTRSSLANPAEFYHVREYKKEIYIPRATTFLQPFR